MEVIKGNKILNVNELELKLYEDLGFDKIINGKVVPNSKKFGNEANKVIADLTKQLNEANFKIAELSKKKGKE